MLEEPKQPLPRWPLVLSGVAGALVLLLAGGAFTWSWLNDSVEASNNAPISGEPMQVALYTPEAPVVQAGGVMDVGEMSNGYEHRERPPSKDAYDVDADWAAGDGGESDPAPALRRPRWVASSRTGDAEVMGSTRPYVEEPRGEIRHLASDPDRRPSFGFDEPGPDFSEQRRLRRERTEDRWRPVPSQAQPRSNWRPVQPSQTRPAPHHPDDVDEDGYAG